MSFPVSSTIQSSPLRLVLVSRQCACCILRIFINTLPCRKSVHPMASWLCATLYIAADIGQILIRFVIWTCPRWRRYSFIQNASSLSVWFRLDIHDDSCHTPSQNRQIRPGSVHVLRCLLSSPCLPQLGHLSSNISWILAVFFWVAQIPMACLDNQSWNLFGRRLSARSRAFQSTSLNASSDHPRPPMLLHHILCLAAV